MTLPTLSKCSLTCCCCPFSPHCSFCFPPGQVADRQTSDGPHAVVLTRPASRDGESVPRRAAHHWGPRGVWVWPQETGEEEGRSREMLVWTASRSGSPQIKQRGLTSCNKSLDLTLGPLRRSAQDKLLLLFL